MHLTKGHGVLARLRDYFRAWLSDGCYDVQLLEKSLKDIFGVGRKMFDIDSAGISGQKIAVTATTLSDASTYIFSNYNGSGIRDKGCGRQSCEYSSSSRAELIIEKGTNMCERTRSRTSHTSGKRKYLVICKHDLTNEC